MVYLVSTLPLVWLLQLKQYDATVAGNTQDDTTVTTTTVAATTSTDTTPAISTVATLTDAFNTTTISMVMTTLTNITINAANISSVTGIQNVTEDLFTNVSSTTISDFIATETENTTTIEANTTILTTTKVREDVDRAMWDMQLVHQRIAKTQIRLRSPIRVFTVLLQNQWIMQIIQILTNTKKNCHHPLAFCFYSMIAFTLILLFSLFHRIY